MLTDNISQIWRIENYNALIEYETSIRKIKVLAYM